MSEPKYGQITDPSRVSDSATDRQLFGALEPDLVIWPVDDSEVRLVIATAAQQRSQIAVVGAGTRASRRAFASRSRNRIVLVSTRMNSVLRIESSACLVHAQAGVRISDLEASLERENLTLGPLPASVATHTLGGVLADPPAEAHTPAAGTLSSRCFALCAITPTGSRIQTRAVPRAAAGPHLGRLLLGSRGTLGVITSATLRVSQVPEREKCCAFAFLEPRLAIAAARDTISEGIRPAALRACLNRQTTRRFSGREDADAHGALIVTLAGRDALVQTHQQVLSELAACHGGTPLTLEEPLDWRQQRDTTRPQLRAYRRLSHSQSEELVSSLPRGQRGPGPLLWLDQFCAHGAILWAGSDGDAPILPQIDAPERRASSSTLSGVPLADALRRALDPSETMSITSDARPGAGQ